MAIFEIGSNSITEVPLTSFRKAGLRERSDLQRLLRDQIEIVAPDVLIVSEEFGEWTDSRRRIDLLGLDKSANLVVIELKRTDDGGHMELQAIRYAAMISTLTAERMLEIFAQYLEARGRDEDPEQTLLDFLDWEELDEEQFAQDLRIILVAADFSRELTTAVMWLNEKELDICCVRICPYDYGGRTLIDVQQVIPLPEATDYQVQVREKKRQERRARKSNRDNTRFNLMIEGESYERQAKRNAILLVVKRLCETGISPDEIAVVLTAAGKKGTWFSVNGSKGDVESFHEQAHIAARDMGKTYNEKRWHTREDDLMFYEGRTYAFTNQWGQTFYKCMDALKSKYPQLDLQCVPTATE